MKNQIWDSSTWTCLRNLTGNTAAVFSIEYISDGTIATGANDGNVIIWNPNTGTQLVSFSPFAKAIYAIREFSTLTVAISGSDSNVYFYKVNGTTTPILIKLISCSAITSYFSMVIATVPFDGYDSKILYVSCASAGVMTFNVTSVSSIALLQTVTIDSSGSPMYSSEKSSIKFDIVILILI